MPAPRSSARGFGFTLRTLQLRRVSLQIPGRVLPGKIRAPCALIRKSSAPLTSREGNGPEDASRASRPTRLLALHLNVAAGYRSGIGIGKIGPVHVDGEGVCSRACVAVVARLHAIAVARLLVDFGAAAQRSTAAGERN